MSPTAPFPGAPITQVALKIPGLIQGSRFTFRTALGRIEDSMNFRIFNSRRQDLELRTRFHLESQEARLALITGVKRALAEADLTNPMDHSEAVGAVETLLGREARIGQGSLEPPPPSLPKDPARELQDRIEAKLTALTRWRETAGTNACFPADARSQQFYEILQAGRRY